MRMLKIAPCLCLGLRNLEGLEIYFPSDGFGALEENVLTGKNMYFDDSSIRNADYDNRFRRSCR